ncbi:helix-turn-helix domain-containing protein [Fulvivirga sp. M361]|uniref:helix-turn-helix domain-containing protein n=1 Tax=Fulvivirga sp. M361 TaxID=2594266 RepID=UPI00117B64D1|nr:helix-turn-helix domain-containing protein [Fulvivirga sp. M361]TRX51201.1 helix-turn-helix domain-containing protein [Fulvivirga sp. M361]
MILTFLDVLVLLGVILGLFLSVLLFSSRSFRSDVHRYFVLVVASLSSILTYVYFEQHFPAVALLELISWEFLFPFAFMMYVLKAIKYPLGSSGKVWWWAAPFLILTLAYFVDFFLGFDLFYWLAGNNLEKLEIMIEVKAFTFLLFSILLVGFSYIRIRRAKGLYKTERRWLELNSLFLLVYLWVWMLGDPITLLFDVTIWNYLLAILAIFLVWVTYRGIHHLNISEQRRQIQRIEVKAVAITAKKEPLEGDHFMATQDIRSPIYQKTADKLQKLNTLMVDEQMYCDPNLTRTMVAEKLNISEGYLSELLGTNLKIGFNDFINKFRVDRAINMFHDRQFHLFSIEAIGFEAGFKSKSVFYTAFKKGYSKNSW